MTAPFTCTGTWTGTHTGTWTGGFTDKGGTGKFEGSQDLVFAGTCAPASSLQRATIRSSVRPVLRHTAPPLEPQEPPLR